MFLRPLLLGCVIAVGAASVAIAGSPTLEKVLADGTLRCGIVATPEDWNKIDLHGALGPLDIEICRAVAAATLGEKAKVDVATFPGELEAEQALSESKVDLIVGVSPEATAMWHWNISFGPPVFYDAQGFLVRHDAPVSSINELSGAKVCVVEGTDNEKILLARTVARGIAIIPMPFQEEGEMDDGLAVRHCDAISAYLSRLAEVKVARPRELGGDKILPDLLTLSPVAPAYRQGDPQWGMIVDWTIFSLIQAEASGVTQANVAAERGSEDPVVRRLLGIDWATSRALGLADHHWAANMIAAVGNYGEIYERSVGSHGSLQMPRGLNALWTKGGLMHPLPVQ